MFIFNFRYLTKRFSFTFKIEVKIGLHHGKQSIDFFTSTMERG